MASWLPFTLVELAPGYLWQPGHEICLSLLGVVQGHWRLLSAVPQTSSYGAVGLTDAQGFPDYSPGMSVIDTRELADEVRRLAERFSSMSDNRLARKLPPYATRADAGRLVAQQLAEAGQGVEESRQSTCP